MVASQWVPFPEDPYARLRSAGFLGEARFKELLTPFTFPAGTRLAAVFDDDFTTADFRASPLTVILFTAAFFVEISRLPTWLPLLSSPGIAVEKTVVIHEQQRFNGEGDCYIGRQCCKDSGVHISTLDCVP